MDKRMYTASFSWQEPQKTNRSNRHCHVVADSLRSVLDYVEARYPGAVLHSILHQGIVDIVEEGK